MQLPSQKWWYSLSVCKPSEIVTLIALAMVAESHPDRIEFRTEDVCRLSGLTRMTLQKALRALSNRGIIKVLSCKSGAFGTTVVALNKTWIQVGG